MRGHRLLEAAGETAAVELGDSELVTLARRGEAMAFRKIMRRNNRHLFRAARGVLRDDAEAEGVVQEAYVRAFQGLAGFRGDASLSTWLTRIALSTARRDASSRGGLLMSGVQVLELTTLDVMAVHHSPR